MIEVSNAAAVAAGAIVARNRSEHRIARHERARPQLGRQPLLTVEENLKTGFGPLRREDKHIPDDVYALFPVLQSMLGRRGGDLSGGQQQQLAIGRALVMRPKLLLLDEPTEGIQPSIIKDIGNVIRLLRQRGDMAILLCEQYFDFAHELADQFVVLSRGEVVAAGAQAAREVRSKERSKAQAEIRQTAKLELGTSGVLDKFKGIHRIPVEAAMELTLKEYQANAAAGRANFVSRVENWAKPPVLE